MWRREFIALAGASVALPFAALAQEPGRIYRLGILAALPRSHPASLNPVLLDELQHRGFIEGKNLVVEWRVTGQDNNLRSQYAAELVKAKVDVILVAGDAALRAAQQATKTIPILATIDDMVGAGFVDSLARPNDNITGVSILATELDGKRQEILIEAFPGIRRMAALADFNRSPVKLEALQEAALARNIELSIIRVAKNEDIAAAINEAHASGATALNVLASPFLFANYRLILDRVAALRLPTIYQAPEVAEEGGLIAYGPRAVPIYREVLTRQLVQLFRGLKPADIPVEQPTKFELVINLKTARAIGVTVPSALLLRADKLIE
jgi:putative ABC transport system substrate-binding protein